MKIVDPTGEQRILAKFPEGDWSDPYTRMGIDPSNAPKSPYEIKPENFPRLLPISDKRFEGTLGKILTEGTINPVLAEKLKQTPENLREGGRR